jgi:cytochrome c oxidase cbb3-type subunit 2
MFRLRTSGPQDAQIVLACIEGRLLPILGDEDRGLPIAATDLTRPERFKTGSRPEDVYRTLMTGLTGTPMPSYGDSLEPDQAWDIAYYVLSLSNNRRRTSEAAR